MAPQSYDSCDTCKIDAIVVSGLSGRFPKSDSAMKLMENLFAGVDMVTSTDGNGPKGLKKWPKRMGKLENLDRFDAEFFGISDFEANHLDPQLRILLEVTFEALIDSGTTLNEIKGTKTGFYYGASFHDTARAWAEDPEKYPAFINRYEGLVPAFFDLKGPVTHIDTACSSSLSALTEAFRAIKSGQCESALVAGYNISLMPHVTQGFMDLRMISTDGSCKCLDKSANGYVRSDALSCVFLQKASVAKRAYMEILNSRCNSDGFKPEGPLFPSIRGQARLMKETYEEIGLDPRKVNYVEAHVTGTQAGDVVETSALNEAFSPGGRDKPLLIGCVKSNLGHSESASSITAIIKSAFIFQKGKIPPSLHFKEPNPNIEALVKGYIKPVLVPEPFDDEYIGINSFGFGGSNGHTIVRKFVGRGPPESFRFTRGGFRLICIPGRSLESVEFAQMYLMSNQNQITREFLNLMDIYSREKGMQFRGFTLAALECGVVKLNHEPVRRSNANSKLKFHLVFDFGMIITVEKAFREIEIWEEISQKFIKASQNIGVQIENSMYEQNPPDRMNIVASTVVVFCLVKLLRHIGLDINLITSDNVLESLSKYLNHEFEEEDILRDLMKMAETTAKKDTILHKMNYLNGFFSYPTNQDRESPNVTEEKRETVQFMRVTRYGLEIFNQQIERSPEDEFPPPTGASIINLKSFLECLGRAYALGGEIDLTELYSAVKYPVPVDTLSLNSIIKWNHSESYKVYTYPEYFRVQGSVDKCSEIDVTKDDFTFLLDHKIDGTAIFPATGYLVLAWIAAARHLFVQPGRLPVCFKDIKILQATLMKKDVLKFVIDYLPLNGKFCIKVGNDVAAEGTIFLGKSSCFESFNSVLKSIDGSNSEKQLLLDSKDIYRELRVRGYDYGPAFQGLVQADSRGNFGQVKWQNHELSESNFIQSRTFFEDDFASQRSWITFTDSLLQLCLFCNPKNRSLMVPIAIDLIYYDPGVFMKIINHFHAKTSTNDSEPVVEVSHDISSQTLGTDGLLIKGITCANKTRRSQNPIFEKYQFIPYIESNPEDIITKKHVESYEKYCQQIIKNRKGSVVSSNTKKEAIACFPVEDPKYSLLKWLLKASNEEESQNQVPPSFCDDILVGNGLLTTERFLRPFIKFFCVENHHRSRNKQVTIAEYNEGSTRLERDIVQYFSYEIFEVKSYYSLQIASEAVPSNTDKTSRHLLKPADLIIMNKSKFSDKLLEQHLTLINHSDAHMILIISSKPKMFFDGTNLTEKHQNPVDEKEMIVSLMSDKGWIMVSERSMFPELAPIRGLLFKKKPEKATENRIVQISPLESSWLPKLQEILKINDNSRVWLTTSNPELSGLSGLFRCLDLEEFASRIRCIQTCPGENSDLKVSDMAFEKLIPAEILKQDLRMNIHSSERGWGSYCHLLTEGEPNKGAKALEGVQVYVYLQCRTVGDLGTLTWIESSVAPGIDKEDIVDVAYASLNFRDIMLASGRLVQIMSMNTKYSPLSTAIGLEFSGYDCNGNRVMGILPDKALATKVFKESEHLCWAVPQEWSLEDAATVPLVYATVLYALFMRGGIKESESILIHAGSGGVGIAALNVCLALGCKVWTTCGSKWKCNFLLETFPQLGEADIFNSRDCNFEEGILKVTDGRGVDLVLNSLSEEKLQASLRCLAPGGRFLEIGKYDMVKDSSFEAGFLDKGRSFHGVDLGQLMVSDELSGQSENTIDSQKKILSNMMVKGIKRGWVKPLPRKVFEMDRVEEAFRFMATGKHVGKVVIKTEQHDANFNRIPLKVETVRTVQFSPKKSYIIVGGFGGIGPELALWMADRGARHFVLNSRSGPKSAYHEYCLDRLKYTGVNVVISREDLTDYEGVVKTIKSNTQPIGGYFNTAGVLSDALFMNLTEGDLQKVWPSKTDITMNFDKASRYLGLWSLDYFVVFSSMASGRGNPGQSNYGHANSSIESICETRRRDKLPGLAIQLGAVGDVGMVVETFGHDVKSVVGTVPQRIHSVLETLGRALLCDNSILCSMIIANTSSNGTDGSTDILKDISNLLGINNITSLDQSTTLAQLGIDSLMAIEMQQVIDRRFGIQLTSRDIRNLKISDLTEFEQKTKEIKDESATQS